jgi:hypothetical protein
MGDDTADSLDRGVVCKNKIVQNGTVLRPGVFYPAGMAKELTQRQLLSVSCSTCGAAPGDQCVLHDGGVRFSPHPARKFEKVRNELLLIQTMQKMEAARHKVAARFKENVRSPGL